MTQINHSFIKAKIAKFQPKWLANSPYLSTAVVSVFLFFMFASGLVLVNAETLEPDDIKIVDIHHDNKQRTIPTRAKTVAEVIDRLEINVGAYDVVEPALPSLLEDETQINIYRATPVAITDKGETKRFLSAYQDPVTIAENAGYQIFPEDNLNWQNTLDNQIARLIEIDRANLYKINLYGQTFDFRSQASNVALILAESGVALSQDDVINPSTETDVNNNSQIFISRFGTAIEVLEQSIPFETVSTNDPSQNIGYVNITKAGVPGAKTVTYEVVYENDIEVSRNVIQEVITRQPINQEQIKGTKVPPPVAGVSFDKQTIMEAAGIARSDWGYVDFIIAKESNWRSTARNPYSGAYGLCQSLPASKMASAGADYITNPVTQMRWCNGYAQSRYGGWAGAYSFWIANRWW